MEFSTCIINYRAAETRWKPINVAEQRIYDIPYKIQYIPGINILRGHDLCPQRLAVVEGAVRYHHQRGGQGQVGQIIVIYGTESATRGVS